MSANFRIDHIVILVKELAAAIEDYTALGFTVTPGGAHKTGLSQNALICFDDTSYLELVTFGHLPANLDAVPGIFRRFLTHGEGSTGLVDFAFLPDNIAAAMSGAEVRGLPFAGPSPGGRVRPDGQEVRWETGRPGSPDLPFLCADLTPRRLRVPDGEARRHPNGVTGIARVTVAVEDLAQSLRRYRALLDAEPYARSTHAADFLVGDTVVTLAAPPSEGNPLYAHIAAGGEGPFALLLKTGDKVRVGVLDAVRAHGARLSLA